MRYKDVLCEAEKILRWRNLHHLMLVPTNALCIPERVNDYNPNYFIVFNAITKKYEVHSVAGGANLDSRECGVPFDALDARLLQYLWEQDVRVHGWDIFRRLELDEEKARKKRDKRFRDYVQAMARETRTMFARSAWGDGEGKIIFPTRGIQRVGS